MPAARSVICVAGTAPAPYQELLQRQAAERSSLQAGVALESAGVRQQPDRDATDMLWAQVPANQNASAEQALPPPTRLETGQQAPETTALAAIDIVDWISRMSRRTSQASCWRS